jgi:hypothetical protein
MSKRVLAMGAALVILVSAVVATLTIVDVLTLQDATETLGKTVSVIVVSIVALVLMITVMRLAKTE